MSANKNNLPHRKPVCGNLFRSSGRRQKRARSGRQLRLEGLEKREMFSVTSVAYGGPSGNVLVVDCNNAATSVTVSKQGANVRVSEVGTNRTWDRPASSVGMVEFHGGAGDDRF